MQFIKVVFCWDIRMPCSTIHKHKRTSVIRYRTFALYRPKLSALSAQVHKRQERSPDGSERNIIYQNFFMDQHSIKGLEIRPLQKSRGKLYALAHSYAMTPLQSLLSGWGKVGEKWPSNFSMPELSFNLRGTLFRICLLLIENKSFCMN